MDVHCLTKADRHGATTVDVRIELEARGYTYVVTFDTALFVKRAIGQYPQPDWIEFTDLFGAKQSVRSQDVFRISESTPQTRASVRAFLRARQKEERADEQPASA